VQLGGLITVFTLGGFMLVMFRRDARQANSPETESTSGTDTKVNG